MNEPRLMRDLDLGELPQGRIHKVRIALAHDEMGRPICAPVLVARGSRPGPVFGITAALHGDEINGVPVIHRLFDSLDPSKLRGTVVGVVIVNVPGFIRQQRVYSDGRDLNHLMPGDERGNEAEVYAHRILDRMVRRFDALVDLHTASVGRINSLYIRANMDHPECASMAFRLQPEIILHNPPSDRTLRGAAEELGIPAVTLEIGNPRRFQPEYIRSSIAGLRRLLADKGLLTRRKGNVSIEPIVCSSSRWLYTDHGGLLEVYPQIKDHLRAGQPIARLTDIYGEVTRTWEAPSDGVVIGKSVDPAARTGARILHLGAIAAPDHPARALWSLT